jgi:hypothetical protein
MINHQPTNPQIEIRLWSASELGGAAQTPSPPSTDHHRNEIEMNLPNCT